MKGWNKAHKMRSPFENLRILNKQILQFFWQTKKCNANQLLLPKETPATFEVFHILNLLLTLPETKLQFSVLLDKTNNMQHYTSSILDTGTNKTMIVFTHGSVQSNIGPAGSGVIIKKQGRSSTLTKIANPVKYMGSSYEGELEAIKVATEYARDKSSLKWQSPHIFCFSVSNISCSLSEQRKLSYFHYKSNSWKPHEHRSKSVKH